MKNKRLWQIGGAFNIKGKILSIIPYGSGLINKTYLITTDTNQYILQKINHYVFKNPQALMENVYRVTKHLNSKNHETLKVIKTKDQKLYMENKNGYYRVYLLINKAKTYNRKSDYRYSSYLLCKEAGIAVGKFQSDLSDMNLNKLEITIPFFHDIKNYYFLLVESLRKGNKDRIKENKDIIKFLFLKYPEVTKISEYLNNKMISLKPCHYDTKLNNILFDKDTHKSRCLIDLDTVMPGCRLFDYADSVRQLMSEANEDEQDLSKIKLNYVDFVAFTTGYLSRTIKYLSDLEMSLLVDSIKTLVLELSIRFLTDYLNDDQYFNIDYEKHNLVRTISQITLYQEIIKEEKHLNDVINNIIKRIK